MICQKELLDYMLSSFTFDFTISVCLQQHRQPFGTNFPVRIQIPLFPVSFIIHLIPNVHIYTHVRRKMEFLFSLSTMFTVNFNQPQGRLASSLMITISL